MVYMAEWYRVKGGIEVGKSYSLYSFGMDPHLMLREFWINLIKNAYGSTVYFTIGPVMTPISPSDLFYPYLTMGMNINL